MNIAQIIEELPLSNAYFVGPLAGAYFVGTRASYEAGRDTSKADVTEKYTTGFAFPAASYTDATAAVFAKNFSTARHIAQQTCTRALDEHAGAVCTAELPQLELDYGAMEWVVRYTYHVHW